MSASWNPAYSTAAVAFVVGVTAALVTLRVARRQREVDQTKTALSEVVTAVLGLRSATWEYAYAVREALRQGPVAGHLALTPTAAIRLGWSNANARLFVAVARVDDVEVVRTVRRWQRLQQSCGLSVLDVSAAAEEAAFQAVVAAVGRASRATG